MTIYPELALTNARILLREGVITGSLKIAADRIVGIETGAARAGEDLGGDLLLPGLVELHTDNLEGHLTPRATVGWPTLPALLAHDGQIVAAGITTVLDSLRLGDEAGERKCVEGVAAVRDVLNHAAGHDLLRADHRLHLRCELARARVVEDFLDHADEPLLRLVSLMDHTPGQRQFVDLEAHKAYCRRRTGASDTELEAQLAARQAEHARWAAPHRQALAALCRERKLTVASHDDATEAHVEEAAGLGLTIAEFPTTTEAAAAARRLGMSIVAGAPNLVRGRSHSGNVAATRLADAGTLDALASDYVPASLLQGAMLLHQDLGWPLPDAVATVSRRPAELAGLHDRGEIAVGKRADLIQVRLHDGFPLVRRVWRAGRRVM